MHICSKIGYIACDTLPASHIVRLCNCRQATSALPSVALPVAGVDIPSSIGGPISRPSISYSGLNTESQNTAFRLPLKVEPAGSRVHATVQAKVGVSESPPIIPLISVICHKDITLTFRNGMKQKKSRQNSHHHCSLMAQPVFPATHRRLSERRRCKYIHCRGEILVSHLIIEFLLR